MRLVLIAESDADGGAWLSRQPAPPARVLIVTRRAPSRARGWEADAVLITEAALNLPAEILDQLRAETLPCVATSRR